MATEQTVHVTGTKEAAKALRKAGDQGLKDDFKAAMLRAAEVVAAAARGTVPVRSGRMQGTIRTGATAKSAVVRAGNAKAPYAGRLIFGWPARNQAPNDFQLRALDATESQVVQILNDAIDKALEGINSDT